MHNIKSIKAFADKNMINTVIRNLITNAIKFTEKGIIDIDTEQNSTHIIVKIKDSGVGIRQDKLKELFNIASSKSTAGTRGETGTGLGLILCKEFILKNNGSIDVESEEGKGSTFSFTLPRAKTD